MKKTEFKIGEEVSFGLIKLKVEKEKDTCEGCFLFKVCSYGLFDSFLISYVGYCREFERDDNTSVVFRKVED